MSAYYRGAFHRHRSSAKQRGIPFLFTFPEWLRIWRDSGHLHQRGTTSGAYQMGRIGDVGPYVSSNVEIVTIRENTTLAARNRTRRLAVTAAST